jgi:hypothetical protein
VTSSRVWLQCPPSTRRHLFPDQDPDTASLCGKAVIMRSSCSADPAVPKCKLCERVAEYRDSGTRLKSNVHVSSGDIWRQRHG